MFNVHSVLFSGLFCDAVGFFFCGEVQKVGTGAVWSWICFFCWCSVDFVQQFSSYAAVHGDERLEHTLFLLLLVDPLNEPIDREQTNRVKREWMWSGLFEEKSQVFSVQMNKQIGAANERPKSEKSLSWSYQLSLALGPQGPFSLLQWIPIQSCVYPENELPNILAGFISSQHIISRHSCWSSQPFPAKWPDWRCGMCCCEPALWITICSLSTLDYTICPPAPN